VAAWWKEGKLPFSYIRTNHRIKNIIRLPRDILLSQKDYLRKIRAPTKEVISQHPRQPELSSMFMSNDEPYIKFFLKLEGRIDVARFYQVRQGRTWSRSYKSPSPPPPTRF
jgi:hypothetical protein